ncbi:TPA: hypothetical protein DEP94_04080 [Candidatus Nomurabacteria bacterium]|nr:hypothetical protein [Candidatus Nomurabacteria bacterium]
MSNKTIGFLSLTLTALILGSFGIWVRILSTDLTIYQQIFFRNFIALLISIALLILAKRKISIKDTSKKYLFIYSIAFPVSVICFTVSILLTKIAITLFALYVGSIISSFIIGTYFFHEKITINKIISIILIFIGLILLTFPISNSNINLGIIFGLLSGIAEAIGNAFRKHLGEKIDRIFLVTIAMISGIILSLALVLINHESLLFFTQISLISWLTGIIFGILLFVVSYLTIVGFQYVELGPGTLIYSSEILFGALFGILFFSEYLNLKEVVGGLLIFLSIMIPYINTKSPQHLIKQ